MLECHALPAGEMPAFLAERFAEPPLDRIAGAFADRQMADTGARAMRAYGAFLDMLDDEATRTQLAGMTEAEADESALFTKVRELGEELQSALLALLFEDRELEWLVRDYLIF